METNKKAQYHSFDLVAALYQQGKGAEFGHLNYRSFLSFLCNWKPLCAPEEGELLPPASCGTHSEEAGCQLSPWGQNFCTINYEN